MTDLRQAPLVVNALGEVCPVPVILLARAVVAAPIGAEVVVLSDDLGAALDIPVWCRMKSQQYLGAEPAPAGRRYRVRRTA